MSDKDTASASSFWGAFDPVRLILWRAISSTWTLVAYAIEGIAAITLVVTQDFGNRIQTLYPIIQRLHQPWPWWLAVVCLTTAVAILNEAVKMSRSLQRFYNLDFPRLLGGKLIGSEFFYPPVDLIQGIPCAEFKGAATLNDLNNTWRKVKILAPKSSIAFIRLTVMGFSRQTSEGPNFEVFALDEHGQPEKIDIYKPLYTRLDENAEMDLRVNFNAKYEFSGNEVIYVAVSGFTFEGGVEEGSPEGWPSVVAPVVFVLFLIGMLWAVRVMPPTSSQAYSVVPAAPKSPSDNRKMNSNQFVEKLSQEIFKFGEERERLAPHEQYATPDKGMVDNPKFAEYQKKTAALYAQKFSGRVTRALEILDRPGVPDLSQMREYCPSFVSYAETRMCANMLHIGAWTFSAE